MVTILNDMTMTFAIITKLFIGAMVATTMLSRTRMMRFINGGN